MQEKDGAATQAVDSVLLWLSREPAALEWMLSRMLPPASLLGILRGLGRPKRPGASPAQAVAASIPTGGRLRENVAQELIAAAPAGAPAAAAEARDAEDWKRVLRDALLTGTEAGADAIRAAMAAADGLLPVCEDPPPSAHPAGRRPAAPSKPRPAPPSAEEELRRSKAECARLEQELSREHARRREQADELDRVRSELRGAAQRASDWKKRLAAATDPGDRERALREEAEKANHELTVLQQKFRLVEEERDDLRACLEDTDRFLALPEEEVPSFRNRPLLPEEVELKARLAQLGCGFRLLVVGGGEPQFRHRDKLAEYAEAMGFAAEWRMAEYVSWHREIDKLAADMKTRFDALVILHYNRTTFTRHARTICDQAGHKPCITCRYEGFTSLRGSLRECLRQLDAAAG